MTDNVVNIFSKGKAPDDYVISRDGDPRANPDDRHMAGTVPHDLLFPALTDLLPCPNPNCRGLPMVVTRAGDVVCNACGAVDNSRTVTHEG